MGRKSTSKIRGENARKTYLFTTCCDREYFNKVSNSEVRKLPRSNGAKGPVKLTLLETYQIALKSFCLYDLSSRRRLVHEVVALSEQYRFLFVNQSLTFIAYYGIFYRIDYKINSHKTRDLL
jgi:hypothetical protein